MLMDPRLVTMPRFPYGRAHFPAHARPVFSGFGQGSAPEDLIGTPDKLAEARRRGYTWLGVGAGAAVLSAFIPWWWLRLALLGGALYTVKQGFEPLCEAGIMEKSQEALGPEAGIAIGALLAQFRKTGL